jgi:acyl-coenzyme A synthetase/AMP-(fatty) acid ligase
VLTYLTRFDAVRPGDFPELRRLLWCGEVFPTPALQYWMERLPHVTFTNLYGPTETTIASSYYTVPTPPADPEQRIPIGAPCPGEELLILDETRAPVPQGEVGEICIRGVGVTLGYWRDEEKTARAFLPCPDRPGERMYTTGDLGFRGPDGLVYCVGRADSQIKSRGHRIELGEIETALNTLPEIGQVAVVARRIDGFGGVDICCAYVPRNGVELTTRQVREGLSRLLPKYMLPVRWQRLAELPRNANGKIDRVALVELFDVEAAPDGRAPASS